MPRTLAVRHQTFRRGGSPADPQLGSTTNALGSGGKRQRQECGFPRITRRTEVTLDGDRFAYQA